MLLRVRVGVRTFLSKSSDWRGLDGRERYRHWCDDTHIFCFLFVALGELGAQNSWFR